MWPRLTVQRMRCGAGQPGGVGEELPDGMVNSPPNPSGEPEELIGAMLSGMSRCPVCGSTSRPTRLMVETTRRFRIEHCQPCGLAFASPRPTRQELADFYTAGYFRRPDDATVGYVDYEGESWAVANAQRMWGDLRVWEPSLADLEPRTLLDVGCATGDFAATLVDDGWAVRGVELADSARSSARAKGVDAVATLADAPADNGLITMFHVLEHVLDPVTMLSEAGERIAPGGRLVIEVPQWGSIGRIIKRHRWSALTPPEHLNFFDRTSIAYVLERTGWVVERIAALHPEGADFAVEAVRQRRMWRALRYTLITEGLERAGVAGYLRVVARRG
jgi:2-polyprenyl-3-methyl-5-hydroxy-6-metoxy-1,4-benzoquinol methylase